MVQCGVAVGLLMLVQLFHNTFGKFVALLPLSPGS